MFSKLIAIAAMAAFAVAAHASPTPKQVEDALAANSFPEARQMIIQVIKEHPDSAQAHLLNAYELAAGEHNKVAANNELQLAASLDKKGNVKNSPLFGRTELTIENIKNQQNTVQQTAIAPVALQVSNNRSKYPEPQSESHWGATLLFLIVLGIALWYIIRRIRTSSMHSVSVPSYQNNSQTYSQYTAPSSTSPIMPVAPVYAAANNGAGMGTAMVAGGLGVVAGAIIADEIITRDRSYRNASNYQNSPVYPSVVDYSDSPGYSRNYTTPAPAVEESVVSTENRRSSFNSGSSSFDDDDRSPSSSNSFSSSTDSSSSWSSSSDSSSSSSDSSSSSSDW